MHRGMLFVGGVKANVAYTLYHTALASPQISPSKARLHTLFLSPAHPPHRSAPGLTAALPVCSLRSAGGRGSGLGPPALAPQCSSAAPEKPPGPEKLARSQARPGPMQVSPRTPPVLHPACPWLA